MGKIWTYYHKVKIVFGCKAFDTLNKEIEAFEGKKVFLVSDPVMGKIGVLDRAVEQIGKDRVVVFDQVPSNPPYQVMDECAEIIKKENCDTVVAIGGGSSIDVAKCSSLLVVAGGSAVNYLSAPQTFTKPGLPLIAIPTTAGTGSEVNRFMVGTDPERQLKIATAPPVAYPKIAILDPEMLLTLPKNQTASTGIDAFSHAIEAYWSQQAQPISDMNALEAMRLSLKWLPKAIEDGSDIEARENTMLASMYASFAFGNTGTCACHAISYPLTVKYGVEHGYACGFTMPEVLDWTWDALGSEKQGMLENVLGVKGKDAAVEKIRDFSVSCGTPAKLSDIGIKPEDIESIPAFTAPMNLKNTNPSVDNQGVIDILKKKM
ncbi:MAG TPA: iron-containing alcohol dehydrogenase [bacterium]|nr:iron-containing alcohol dehydrogenase [bacterium]